MANDDDGLFQRWTKYEEVAMHFNELLMKLTTQALGGLAAIAAISGISVSLAGEQAKPTQWWVVSVTLAFLGIAWIAIGVIDIAYYHRLLLGAVDALLELETKSNGRLDLSRRIEEQFGEIEKRKTFWGKARRTWPLGLFYLAVLAGIIAGSWYTCVLARTTPPHEQQTNERGDEGIPADTS